jgi:hypothetical protein
MLDEARIVEGRDGDYVAFFTAGTEVSGEFLCAQCGYGVTLRTKLPLCPMCGSTSWERPTWAPARRD